MRKLDLTGRVYGRLTILEDVGRDKYQQVIWKCLCDCGNTVDVRSGDLQKGYTQSCGCLQKERTSETNKKDLTNQKFGRLVVLEDVGRRGGKVIWRCQCECGNIVDVSSDNLQSGHTQSCGCYKKDQTMLRQSGDRNWNWRGGITPLNHVIRNCTRYKEWRTSIFHKDNFTCVHCGTRGGKYLHAHHIKFFSVILEEYNITTLEEALQCEALWDVSNGITLCVECHEEEHRRLKALDIVEPM
jgi:5-methylcytosine-specific restriction endonuclease McrA